MNKSRIASVFTACALSVALMACGGGGSNTLRASVQAAIVAAAASGESPIDVSTSEAKCITDRVLKDKDAAAALEAARAAGKTGQDMLDAVDSSGRTFGKSVFQCLDVKKIVNAFASSLASNGAVTEEQTQCLTDAFTKIDRDVLADVLTNSGQSADSVPSNVQLAITTLESDIGKCAGQAIGSGS